MTLGIDWDGTADRYGKAIGKLCDKANKQVIISLNRNINRDVIRQHLNIYFDNNLHIEIMPDSAFTSSNNVFEDVAKWKYDMCKKHNVDVMIDDEITNINYLTSKGIACIKCDGDWIFSEKLGEFNEI